MGKGAVDHHVVVAPGIVGCGPAFGSFACGSGDDGGVDVGVEQQVFGQGYQREFHGHCEAAWIGHMLGSAHHRLAVQF